MFETKKQLETLQLESVLRTFQRFLGKPLRYRNWCEPQGHYEDEQTPEGVVKNGRWVETHEIRYHTCEHHGFTFWLDPTSKKWRWSVTVTYPGSRWEPPSADEIDQEGEFDHLWQLSREIVVTLLTHQLDEYLVDEGMCLAEVESRRWESEAREQGLI